LRNKQEADGLLQRAAERELPSNRFLIRDLLRKSAAQYGMTT